MPRSDPVTVQSVQEVLASGSEVRTHGAGTERAKRWTLDGEPFDIEESDLAPEDRAAAEALRVGDETIVGGGAFATFALKRVA